MLSTYNRARRFVVGLVTATLALVGVAVATPASAAFATLTVTGTVYQYDGTPASDWPVSLYSDLDWADTTTAADGTFSATLNYTTAGFVEYQMRGGFGAVDLASLAGASTVDVDVTLDELWTVTIEGHITNAVGDPLEGRQVEVFQYGEFYGYTDASGFYSITFPAFPNATIQVTPDVPNAQTFVDEFSDGSVITLDYESAAGGDPVTITLHGTGLNSDGSPMPLTPVLIYADTPDGFFNYYDTATDENGEFVIDVETSTTGTITASLDYHANGEIVVSELGGATDAYITLQIPAVITVTFQGHVYDSGGNSVEGAEVSFGSSIDNGYTYTDADGFYSGSTQAYQGEWVYAYAFPAQDSPNATAEYDGQIIEFDFNYPNIVSVTVHGHVEDSAGNDVVGQSVSASSSVGWADGYTDDAGNYSLTFDAAVGDRIAVQAYPIPGIGQFIVVGDGQSFVYNFYKPDLVTVTVTGIQLDADGNPAAYLGVSAGSGVDWQWGWSQEDGTYSIVLTALDGDDVYVYSDDYSYEGKVFHGVHDGDVLVANFGVAGPGYDTVLIDGLFLDADGNPVAGEDVTIATDVDTYVVTSLANGSFEAQIEYTPGGFVELSADHAALSVDPADLAGHDGYAVTLQKLPDGPVTIEGYLTDMDGNPVPGNLVAAYALGSAYTFTDATGYYKVTVEADPFASIAVMAEGNEGPEFLEGAPAGSTLWLDLVLTGGGTPLAFPAGEYACDVDGDGSADTIAEFLYPSTGDLRFDVPFGGDVRSVAYTGGEIDATYCADLTGGGQEFIVRSDSTVIVNPATGKTVTNHDWWIYDAAADEVTTTAFGQDALRVYVADLDGDGNDELIAEHPSGGKSSKWWIYDGRGIPVETAHFGFGAAGTVALIDVDGAPGVDIVTTLQKKNATVSEYYTRSGGVGHVVK